MMPVDRRHPVSALPHFAGLAAVALLAAMLAGCSGDGTSRSEPSQPDDAAGPMSAADPPLPEIDPALIRYEQTAEIPTGLEKATALAVGPGDEIYVGGDRRLCRFASDGKKRAEIPLAAQPTCLAVLWGTMDDSNWRIYVGMEKHVEVFDPGGRRIAVWDPPGKNSLLTSLAASDLNVFVADAGERIVWRYTTDGKQKTRIGDADPARNIPGFFITDSHFDLGLGADGLLYVVNPRALRLEGYTAGGDLEVTWGKGSPAIEDFFGCCNPAHFAVLPDGRFVTAEKGFPRIKVYSPQGKFECVVAGPRQMKHTVADLAADRRGRVLALDPSTASVRVFQRKKDVSGEKR